ncbi:MAG: hypothetical protein M1517_04910, partial [Deltaproteobacteria bacterium]|nr:hypothetical protein [Deltaproteobacteria bacterium]
EQKERVFDTAKGNTSGLPAMLPWYSAWTASLSLWKYGDVMGRNPLYRKELCFTSRGEKLFLHDHKWERNPYIYTAWV